MSVEKRLGEMFRVASGEARCLVIGYHAARFYGAGVSEPADHSLYVEADEAAFAKLAKKLSKKKATSDADFSWPAAEAAGETYRLVRAVATLPAFEAAWKRRSSGRYGGQNIEFLGLEDLLSSLETNEGDWPLLAELERVADERRIDACEDPDNIARALANMRSVQGYERAHGLGYYKDAEAVAEAAKMVTHPVAQAFLLPYQATPGVGEKVTAAASVRAILDNMLVQSENGEPKLALVEAVRRAHQLSKMSPQTE